MILNQWRMFYGDVWTPIPYYDTDRVRNVWIWMGMGDMSGMEDKYGGGRYGWGVEVSGFPLVGATIGSPFVMLIMSMWYFNYK